MNRRKFMHYFRLAGLSALLARSGHIVAQQSDQTADIKPVLSAEQRHQQAMDDLAGVMGGRTAVIGMLVYPGMFLQDFVGPYTVFQALMLKEIHILWKNSDPIGQGTTAQQSMVSVHPTTTFENCPENLDVLFVPGGVPGTFDMMEDQEVLDFLSSRGDTSRFITSVCTGSLILAAAGLLRGYKATSYWNTREALAEMGAIPTQGRIVTDRNRITGGGVTAGIDFGLYLASLLTNETYAKAIQLYLEYDPQPPFDAGSPEKAPPQVTEYLNEMFASTVEMAMEVARRAGKRTGN
jgi:cyclohexyl-isocyanide hydratase